MSSETLRHRLYHGTTQFDFVGKLRIGLAISAVVLAVSAISLFTKHLNLGLDFEGGTQWEMPVKNITTDGARDVLSKFSLADGSKIQTLSGAGSESRIRLQAAEVDAAKQTEVKQALADANGVKTDDIETTFVSSSWGKDITNKAVKALVIFFIVLAVYISFRFEWKMAIGAFGAMAHDVFISVGVYSLFGFEVTPATVIAFLTILGFSLYDTIVVFDKVHENENRLTRGGRATYADIVNLSMNQVLMRSINTSLAALLPVLSLLVVGANIMGATALLDFSLALFVGLLTGAYSSIYIATPVLYLLKRNERPYSAAKDRARRLGPTSWDELHGRVTTTAVATGPALAGQGAGGQTTVTARPSGPTHPPRPRKKRK
jgi:preprotein translocase subunit SecF